MGDFILNPTIHSNRRVDTETFKSNICHKLKELGDIDFLLAIIEENIIENYYEEKQYFECLYILAMVDYLSRIHSVPLCTRYEAYRHLCFSEPIFPSSTTIAYLVTNDITWKQSAIDNAIPEFIRFNIVEGDIRDVV